MKKTLLFSIAVCVLTLTASLRAAVSGDYEYTDNGDGTCTITRYTGPSGEVVIPDTLNGLTVTTIADNACAQRYFLTGLTIPHSVISIGQRAFSFSGLTDITVVPTNPVYSSVDGVLFNKSQTELIRYPERKAGDYTIPGSVTLISNEAFSGCINLAGIMTIPDTIENIGDGAFIGCSSLSNITVDLDNPTYSSFDGALFNKTQTVLIQCPEGKAGPYTIPNSVTTIADYSFYWCQSLTGTLIIPDSVTTIGDLAFFYCSGLTDLTIGNKVTSIDNFAFGRCSGLTNIRIGNNVTSIGQNAFLACKSLTCVIIPESITSLGYRGFYACSSLRGLYFKGDPPALGSDVFKYTNATVYYLPAYAADWPATFGGLLSVEWPLSIADVDMNGDVNLWDFATFAAAWWAVDGVDPAYDPLCDISDPADGIIDTADLQVFVGQWLITPCCQ